MDRRTEITWISAAKILSLLIFSFLLAMAIDSVSVFAKECADIRSSVLRLHILANSDTEEDQRTKLKVRDRILQETESLFYWSDGLRMAKQKARASLPRIEKIAAEELRRLGKNDTVHAELIHMFFETRVYERFTMPAGYYDAVRVTIGKAKGKNWWCVLYPPLCVPAASSEEELARTLTHGQREIVESKPQYEIRFYAIELFEKAKEFFTQQK
ncbi:MAG: stage II sporulation protein R [Oscillospiraceae bacterium]